MKILLNGKQREIESSTLEGLLRELDLDPRLVAVEVNEDIVRKKDYNTTRLAENHKVEIVHLVGGGSVRG